MPTLQPSPIVISRVLPQSAAEAAGFRVGDRLVAIGATSIDRTSRPLDASLVAIRTAMKGTASQGTSFKGTSTPNPAAGVAEGPGTSPYDSADATASPTTTAAAPAATGTGERLRRKRASPPPPPPFAATVDRGGATVRLSLPAERLASATAAADGRLGIELSQRPSPGTVVTRVKLPPREAASRATEAVGRDTGAIVSTLRGALGSLLPSATAGGEGGATLQGPLGIARMGGELASSDALRLLEFGAVLSLNLAVFNSLPLPGLDGWQMAILAAESAAGRRLPEDAKEGANAVATLLFLAIFARVLAADLGVGSLAGSVVASPSDALAPLAATLREVGPSVALGLLLAQTIKAVRGGGSGDEAEPLGSSSVSARDRRNRKARSRRRGRGTTDRRNGAGGADRRGRARPAPRRGAGGSSAQEPSTGLWQQLRWRAPEDRRDDRPGRTVGRRRASEGDAKRRRWWQRRAE